MRNRTIKNGLKVSLWEVRKLVWNKSFIISLLLTPFIWGAFVVVPRLFEMIEEPAMPTRIYILDEVGVFESLVQKTADIEKLVLEKYPGPTDDLKNKIKDNEHAGFVHLTKEVFETRQISIIIGKEETYVPVAFEGRLRETLTRFELAGQNVETTQIDRFIAGYVVGISSLAEQATKDPMYPIRKWVPPIFAMIIFFLVFISGMTTMQSVISDKRDKTIEILLSSISANSLMYGKIVGNFIAGLIQVALYLVYGLMFLHFVGFPEIGRISADQLLSFVVSPQLPLMLLFALLGYLFFSSIYAGLGATIEDLQNAGNFQGIVMMLPALSFVFISPIIANPDGIIAQIGSYIPFTASVVMILRFALTDLSLFEIIVSITILALSTTLIAALAGKIFRVGMLMYGKEADPKEIWKWLRQ